MWAEIRAAIQQQASDALGSGETLDELVFVVAERGTAAAREGPPLPEGWPRLICVPLGGFFMNDAAIMAAVAAPPPPGTVRLLWLGLGRWELVHHELTNLLH